MAERSEAKRTKRSFASKIFLDILTRSFASRFLLRSIKSVLIKNIYLCHFVNLLFLFSALNWSGRSDRMRAMERALRRVLIGSFVPRESATPTPAQVATLRATSQFGQKLMPFFNTYSSNRSLNLLRAELQTRIFTNINSLYLNFIFQCSVCTLI